MGRFFARGLEPSGILILTPNSTLKLLTAGQVEGLDVHVFEDFDVACVCMIEGTVGWVRGKRER